MKDFEYNYVEPAVLIIGFNRAYSLQELFERLSGLNFRKIYFALDGPRLGFPDDEALCNEVLVAVREFSQGRSVEILKSHKNLGLKARVVSGVTYVLKREPSVIVLEDDCIPNRDFFVFCDHFLRFFSENSDIFHINGQCLLPADPPSGGSMKSRYAHCWGWATWSDRWGNVEAEFDDFNIAAFFWSMLQNFSLIETVTWIIRFSRVRNGSIKSWAYMWQYCIWKKKGFCITPPVNLVSNVGFGPCGTNTLVSNSDLGNLPFHDLPKPCFAEVFHDDRYDKNLYFSFYHDWLIIIPIRARKYLSRCKRYIFKVFLL